MTTQPETPPGDPDLEEAKMWIEHNSLYAQISHLKARIAEFESELSTIKAQASDSTEYVLAQVNRELRETNSALICDLLTAQQQLIGERISDEAFISLISALMEADPWPYSADREPLTDLADSEARARGYSDWIEALHKFTQDCFKSEALPNE